MSQYAFNLSKSDFIRDTMSHFILEWSVSCQRVVPFVTLDQSHFTLVAHNLRSAHNLISYYILEWVTCTQLRESHARSSLLCVSVVGMLNHAFSSLLHALQCIAVCCSVLHSVAPVFCVPLWPVYASSVRAYVFVRVSVCLLVFVCVDSGGTCVRRRGGSQQKRTGRPKFFLHNFFTFFRGVGWGACMWSGVCAHKCCRAFLCSFRPLPICPASLRYVCHDSFTSVPWPIHVCLDSFITCAHACAVLCLSCVVRVSCVHLSCLVLFPAFAAARFAQ